MDSATKSRNDHLEFLDFLRECKRRFESPLMDQIIGNIGLLFEFPIVNLKILLDGIMIGALFALAAYGLALVWGVMNVKNLAQGDFVIAGGYVAWTLDQNGVHPFIGIPAAFIVMWLIGWITYKLVIKRVIERDLFTSLLATFGLAIMMAQILNLIFGSDTQSIQLDTPTLYFADGFIDVPASKLIGVTVALTLAFGVIVFMKRSRMGQAIRATAQDARAARVLGIDTDKVYSFTFSLNSAICGAAGAIIVIGYQQAIAVLLLLLVLFFRLLQQRRKRQVLQ
jgi:branched-chain amino acid transport system permease protein